PDRPVGTTQGTRSDTHERHDNGCAMRSTPVVAGEGWRGLFRNWPHGASLLAGHRSIPSPPTAPAARLASRAKRTVRIEAGDGYAHQLDRSGRTWRVGGAGPAPGAPNLHPARARPGPRERERQRPRADGRWSVSSTAEVPCVYGLRDSCRAR